MKPLIQISTDQTLAGKWSPSAIVSHCFEAAAETSSNSLILQIGFINIRIPKEQTNKQTNQFPNQHVHTERLKVNTRRQS